MLDISQRSSAARIPLLLIYPLAIAGYPLVSALPVLLGVSSRIFSVPYRAFVLLLSLFVLARLAKGVTRSYRGLFWAPFLFFWGIYSLRLVSDTVIAPIALAFRPYEYFLFAYGTCLLPTLAFMAQPNPTLTKTSAKATLLFASIAALAALGAIWFGVTRGATEAVETGRLQSETLDPISLGHLGASVVILSVYLALDETRAVRKAFLTIVAGAGLILVALASSRGPVLSLTCAMLIIFGARFSRRPSIGKIVALVGVVTVVITIFYWVENSLGFKVVSGLTSLENLDYDPSGALRIESMRGGWRQFLDNPLFGSAIEEQSSHYYPHNVVIEAFMAGGIFLGVVFTSLLIWASASAIRLVYADTGAGWIGVLFIQYAAAAMTSGALFASNTMWSLMVGVVAMEATRALRKKGKAPHCDLSR